MLDKKIIEQCIKGKRSAQKKLYDQYSKQMYSICLRYCKRSDIAADALQMAFIKVFRSIKNFNFEGSFEGWIRRIVVNCSLDQLKLEKRIFEDIEDKYVTRHLQTEIDVNFDSYNLGRMMSYVKQLPEGYQIIFSMYVIDELPHKEIARILNISKNTSRSQLLKARKMLQSMFVKDHYLSSQYNLN